MTKEIEELRAKRLSHDLYKKTSIDQDFDDDDDFGTAIFAETLLGELGSSSGSHKDEFEDDDGDAAILDGDSGASDRGSRTQKQQPDATQTTEAADDGAVGALPSTEELKTIEAGSLQSGIEELKDEGNQLPIVDMPVGSDSNIESMKLNRAQLETKLVNQLESEISNLLGSIKVQASSIKETLKKQKSILTEDSVDSKSD